MSTTRQDLDAAWAGFAAALDNRVEATREFQSAVGAVAAAEQQRDERFKLLEEADQAMQQAFVQFKATAEALIASAKPPAPEDDSPAEPDETT